VKIHSGFNDFVANNPVVTIGMFDGLHMGHRQLLKTVVGETERIGGESVVITFWPHPRIVLNKDPESLRILTSLEEKTKIFSGLNVDHLVVIPFTLDLASLTSLQFTSEVLVGHIGMKHLVVGFNHRFGSDSQLNLPNYEAMGQTYGFGVTRVPAVMHCGLKASSTAIRNLLEKGNVEDAGKLLTYPYRLTGRVVGGNRMGRTINFPTANIEVEDSLKLVPAKGVYACRVFVVGRSFNGMLNIGYRPTIQSNNAIRSIEVHIFDFQGDIYSEEIEVEFIYRVRNEIQFAGIEELKAQLVEDEKTIRELLHQ
jgi:riboflavin kinase/FMN adenylyltransferase